MLKNILTFVFIVFYSLSYSLAYEEKIAVIVNKTPITESEVYARKNLIIKMKDLKKLSTKDRELLRESAIQSLIDDVLITEEALANDITFEKSELQNYISKIEESQKMKKGELMKKFSNDKDVKNSFLQKIKAEIIKSKFSNEFVVRMVDVSPSEVNEIAIKFAGKDAKLSLREFTTSDNDDESYKTLMKLRKTAKNCSKKYNFKNANIEDIETTISELNDDEKHRINSLKKDEFSSIEDVNGHLKMIQVCSIAVDVFSEEESNILTNYIGNKKLNHKMLKYIETLRNKSYIKIMSN